MMLCGVSVVFNSLGDALGLMSCKSSSENGQVLVGFQSTAFQTDRPVRRDAVSRSGFSAGMIFTRVGWQ
jgi:hypothetical protein